MSDGPIPYVEGEPPPSPGHVRAILRSDDGRMPGMGKVERLMIEAIARHPEGLTTEEALDTIVPPDNPKLRFRPAYKYCFDRLASRHMVDFVFTTGPIYCVLELVRYGPSDKAMAELVNLPPNPGRESGIG